MATLYLLSQVSFFEYSTRLGFSFKVRNVTAVVGS